MTIQRLARSHRTGMDLCVCGVWCLARAWPSAAFIRTDRTAAGGTRRCCWRGPRFHAWCRGNRRTRAASWHADGRGRWGRTRRKIRRGRIGGRRRERTRCRRGRRHDARRRRCRGSVVARWRRCRWHNHARGRLTNCRYRLRHGDTRRCDGGSGWLSRRRRRGAGNRGGRRCRSTWNDRGARLHWRGLGQRRGRVRPGANLRVPGLRWLGDARRRRSRFAPTNPGHRTGRHHLVLRRCGFQFRRHGGSGGGRCEQGTR